MIRALLSLLICSLCGAIGLATAFTQSGNYDRAARLDELKRKCDLVEAGNESLRYEIRLRMAELDREVEQPESMSDGVVNE